MEHIYKRLYPHRRLLMGAAVFLLFSAVAVKISGGVAEPMWKTYPGIAILILVAGLALVMVYIQLDQYRLTLLSKQIQALHHTNRPENNPKIHQLTSRQPEIYALIRQGKSNKEIMHTLFIEASTLKTHINQIYKKLAVKSRRELLNPGAGET